MIREVFICTYIDWNFTFVLCFPSKRSKQLWALILKMLGCDDVFLSSLVYFRKFLRNLLEIGLVFGSKQKCTFLFFTHTQFIRQNTLRNRNKNKSISISSDSKNGEINCNNKGIRCSGNKLSEIMLALLKVISSLPHKASHFHGFFSIRWTYCSSSFVSVPIEILLSNYFAL